MAETLILRVLIAYDHTKLWRAMPFDTLSRIWPQDYDCIKMYFFRCNWYEVYNLLEFIARKYQHKPAVEFFTSLCNHVFERELSGYRFIDLTITPITSQEEIKEVEDALAIQGKLAPVANHINAALLCLSRRENPDYRNSIKESISAVESICCLISQDSKASLGKALKVISNANKVDLHPALNNAFKQLYGYTSDADGIRHALLDDSNVDFEDAKFMLISCSAFVNYLKGKAIKAGLNLDV